MTRAAGIAKSRPMATWLIIAILGTIGVTALLIGALHRINAPRERRKGDGGDVNVAVGGSSGSGRQQADNDSSDSGSDSGGDGGGGGGD